MARRRINLTNGLVGHWSPWLAATGTRLLDRSGRNNHGTLTNMANTAWVGSSVRGRAGFGLDFDGTNDFVDLGSGLPNTFTTASFSIWYRVGSVNTKQALISSYTASPQGGWGLEQLANNTLNFFGFTNTTQATDVQSSVTVSVGQLVHVVGVFNRGTFQLYFNGFLNNTNTGVTSIYKTGSVRIGRTISDEIPFSGRLFDLPIWSRVLTGSEVQELYNRGPVLNRPLRRIARSYGSTGNRRRRILCGDYN